MRPGLATKALSRPLSFSTVRHIMVLAQAMDLPQTTVLPRVKDPRLHPITSRVVYSTVEEAFAV